MFKIPEEFCHLPEAARLREAQAQFEAAIKLGKPGWQRSAERLNQVGTTLRRAQVALQEAQAAFDTVTGEPKPVGLTPAVVGEISRQFPASARKQVEEMVDRSCGRTLPFQREATAQELEHIRLCVVRLSRGDHKKLREWIDLANVDWRDVLLAAQTDKVA
jgi:hypothetical protein